MRGRKTCETSLHKILPRGILGVDLIPSYCTILIFHFLVMTARTKIFSRVQSQRVHQHNYFCGPSFFSMLALAGRRLLFTGADLDLKLHLS